MDKKTSRRFHVGQSYEWQDWFTGGITQFTVKRITEHTVIMRRRNRERDGEHLQEEIFSIETDDCGNERIMITEYKNTKGFIYARESEE